MTRLLLLLLLLLSAGMTPIPQDKRVSMGVNGDLYFSNVMAQDAHTDYSCNARFLFTHTIQQKNPFTLKVQTSEYTTYAHTHTLTHTLTHTEQTADLAVGSTVKLL